MGYHRKSEKHPVMKILSKLSQGEEAPCQEKEAAAGPPQKSTGDDDATPPAYPSIWTKGQYEQFESKN